MDFKNIRLTAPFLLFFIIGCASGGGGGGSSGSSQQGQTRNLVGEEILHQCAGEYYSEGDFGNMTIEDQFQQRPIAFTDEGIQCIIAILTNNTDDPKKVDMVGDEAIDSNVTTLTLLDSIGIALSEYLYDGFYFINISERIVGDEVHIYVHHSVEHELCITVYETVRYTYEANIQDRCFEIITENLDRPFIVINFKSQDGTILNPTEYLVEREKSSDYFFFQQMNVELLGDFTPHNITLHSCDLNINQCIFNVTVKG